MIHTAVEYEGNEPLICIWEQPYEHGGEAQNALGWYTLAEAEELTGIPATTIKTALQTTGTFDTEQHSMEWT